MPRAYSKERRRNKVELFTLFLLGSYLIFIFFSLWCYGTILKAALGVPKWYIIFTFIPIVNIILVIIWGLQAHNKLIEQEQMKN